MQAALRAAEDGLKPVPHEKTRGCDWLRRCPTLQSHYNPFVVTRLCQSAAAAGSPWRREIKLADAQLKHFTFLQGRHSSPFTSEPERTCINVEVFINGVKINASLKSITTWEPVHRLPIDWSTLISLIHLIAPDVIFFRLLRNWRLVVFSWVLRLEFYYHLAFSVVFISCFHWRGRNLGPPAWEHPCPSFPRLLISGGPRHFLGEMAVKVTPNNSVPLLLSRSLPLHHVVSTGEELQPLFGFLKGL